MLTMALSIVVVAAEESGSLAAPVRGLHRIYGRKIDRDKLIRAITAASREHKQALTLLRGQPEFEQRYQFGTVKI